MCVNCRNSSEVVHTSKHWEIITPQRNTKTFSCIVPLPNLFFRLLKTWNWNTNLPRFIKTIQQKITLLLKTYSLISFAKLDCMRPWSQEKKFASFSFVTEWVAEASGLEASLEGRRRGCTRVVCLNWKCVLFVLGFRTFNC